MTGPADLAGRWEAAYDGYSRAVEWAAATDQSPDAAQAVATRSREVAELWRALAELPHLAWWSVAALHTAAAVFTAQAYEWHQRATRTGPRRMYIQKES